MGLSRYQQQAQQSFPDQAWFLAMTAECPQPRQSELRQLSRRLEGSFLTLQLLAQPRHPVVPQRGLPSHRPREPACGPFLPEVAFLSQPAVASVLCQLEPSGDPRWLQAHTFCLAQLVSLSPRQGWSCLHPRQRCPDWAAVFVARLHAETCIVVRAAAAAAGCCCFPCGHGC